KETVPGYYSARITSIVPVAGMKLRFTVDSPVLVPLSRTLLPRKPAITGTGIIGSLAVITQPAAGASLSAAALGESLTVSWKGGAAPFTIGLMKPSGSAVLSIFEQAGLPGTSYPLPAALMPPGLTYSIIVMYNMKPFALQASGKELPSLLDKSSSVTLGGSDIITTSIF
ncbi:MAG: hypothetical protein RBS43_11745, partial [Candidatus Cloacimonas sp.]|nr:hypothetical protein [Candidatus Cloacimonas sp.]